MFVLVLQIQMEYVKLELEKFQIRKLVSRFVLSVNALDGWLNF